MTPEPSFSGRFPRAREYLAGQADDGEGEDRVARSRDLSASPTGLRSLTLAGARRLPIVEIGGKADREHPRSTSAEAGWCRSRERARTGRIAAGSPSARSAALDRALATCRETVRSRVRAVLRVDKGSVS